MFLERIEGLFASLTDSERQTPSFAQALDEIARDAAARDRYLRFADDADQPQVRARMIRLAGALGWLSPAEERAELVRMIGDLLARNASARRSRSDLRAERGPGAGRRARSPAAAAPAVRQGDARSRAGMPRQHRRPRARSAGTDQSRRGRGADRRGLSGAPADHRRRGASRMVRRDHAHDRIGRADPRAQYAVAPSAERPRRAWTTWRASFPRPSPSTCSGRSPRSSFAPSIRLLPRPEMVQRAEPARA